jgi:hypothetical protein
MVGAPASPAISVEATAAVAAALTQTSGIAEAHLPQFFAVGVSEAPTQALVLVLAPDATPDRVMATLGPKLGAIIPAGVYLDVWPLAPSHALLPAVRGAGCRIYKAQRVPRPWWKFWA